MLLGEEVDVEVLDDIWWDDDVDVSYYSYLIYSLLEFEFNVLLNGIFFDILLVDDILFCWILNK